jgi:hypothetical protein
VKLVVKHRVILGGTQQTAHNGDLGNMALDAAHKESRARVILHCFVSEPMGRIRKKNLGEFILSDNGIILS